MTQPAAGETDQRRSWAVVVTLALTGVVVSLQQTLVLPLLPDLPELLDTTADNASWLVTATLLFGAVSIPTVTRLADMFGKKRMVMVTLAVMVLGSALGAMSISLPVVILARALQGVGLSLIPVGIAIMRDELPRERVPLGVALMSASLAIGSGAGLPLSGLIAARLDWHAIFWVTGFIGAMLLIAVWRVVDESAVQTRGSFDYRGAIIGSTALMAIMLALSKGAHWGWSSGATLALAFSGALLLAAWVPLELRVRNPLVNVRVAARPAVLLVNIASLLVGFAAFANMLMTPQLLQLPVSTGYSLGFDVLHTGLWMAPIGVVFGVMAPVSARLIRRHGPQMTLLAGSFLMAAAYVARVYLAGELWQIVAGSVLVAAGTSVTYAAFPTLIMRAVPVTESASANGLNTLLRYIGTATASAVMAAVFTMSVSRNAGQQFPSFDAFLVMFWISAIACLLAGLIALPVLALREPDEDAEDRIRGSGRVIRGQVLKPSGRPVRHAVVTVLTPTGGQVDWSQVDSAGDFSVAIPGSGRYLIVAAAEGWTPESRLVDMTVVADLQPIVLAERLTLSGVVTSPSGPIGNAVVALTRQSGEAIDTATTAVDGHYEMPLPPNGRYVLTAATSSVTAARAVTVSGGARVVGLTIPNTAKQLNCIQPIAD